MSMYTQRITYVTGCVYLYPHIYRHSYKIKAFFLVNTTHGQDGDGVLPTSDPLINSKKWVLFFFSCYTPVPALTKRSLPSTLFFFFSLAYKRGSLAFIKGLNVSLCRYNRGEPKQGGGCAAAPADTTNLVCLIVSSAAVCCQHQGTAAPGDAASIAAL